MEEYHLEKMSKSESKNKDSKPKKGLCFVIMPFGGIYDIYYEIIYKSAIEECEFEAKRADDFYKPTEIMTDIWKSVNEAKILLADVTNKNPNVFYELGLAHAVSKPVIIIAPSNEDIPFDLRAIRHIIYDKSRPDWGYKLKDDIKRTLLNAESFTSIPKVFTSLVESNNPFLNMDLGYAIHDSMQNLVKIDHLRILAHSTSTIYNQMSEYLKKITVDNCEIILRKYTEQDIQDPKLLDEQNIINRNKQNWEGLQSKGNIKNLKIYFIEHELTEYQIIIEKNVLITGIYYLDNKEPSGIGYQNTICANSINSKETFIEKFVSRFDKLKESLQVGVCKLNDGNEK